MDPGDASVSLGGLLDKYLKHAPVSQLLQESRITQTSADALYAMQDLVYLSTDAGELKDMFSGMAFKEGEESLALDQVPTNHQVQVEDQEVSVVDLTIDRINLQYSRNWTSFHRRKWLRNESRYSGFVRDSLIHEFGGHELSLIHI